MKNDDYDYEDDYEETKIYFQQAADLGLVEIVQLSAEAVEINQSDCQADANEEIPDAAIEKISVEFKEKL